MFFWFCWLIGDMIQCDFGRGTGCWRGGTEECCRGMRLLMASWNTFQGCSGCAVWPCRTMVAVMQRAWRQPGTGTLRWGQSQLEHCQIWELEWLLRKQAKRLPDLRDLIFKLEARLPKSYDFYSLGLWGCLFICFLIVWVFWGEGSGQWNIEMNYENFQHCST